MIARVSEDRRHLIIETDSKTELEQLSYSYKKKIRNKFKLKNSKWNGIVNFLELDRKLPIGLWKDLIDLCKQYGLPLQIKGMNRVFNEISYEEVEDFCHKLLETNDKITPTKKQIDAVHKSFHFNNTLLSLSTRAGKTLIIFMLYKLLMKKLNVKRILIITISPNIVTQNYEDFIDYAGGIQNMLEVGVLLSNGSASKRDENKPVIISNFHYLGNKPDEYFHNFDAIFVDECHRTSAMTIKNILKNSVNAKFFMGCSGSIIEDNSVEFYQLMSFFGPIVKRVTKYQLIEDGSATKGRVEIFKLDYLSEEYRQKLYEEKNRIDGEKVLKLEQRIYRASKLRLEWICKLINKFNRNVLVFFLDVDGGYGLKIVDKLKQITTDKNIFYIDENVSVSNRGEFKRIMEKSDNNILIATYGTFSTGETLKNLHYVVCAEGIKDEVRLSQSMGRPMSLNNNKDEFIWIDIVDDFSLTVTKPNTNETETVNNYSIKWSKERRKYYDKERFKYNTHTVSLKKNYLTNDMI